MHEERRYNCLTLHFTREETFSIMMRQHNSAQSTSVTCGIAVTPGRGFALSNIHNFWAEQIKASRVQ